MNNRGSPMYIREKWATYGVVCDRRRLLLGTRARARVLREGRRREVEQNGKEKKKRKRASKENPEGSRLIESIERAFWWLPRSLVVGDFHLGRSSEHLDLGRRLDDRRGDLDDVLLVLLEVAQVGLGLLCLRLLHPVHKKKEKD